MRLASITEQHRSSKVRQEPYLTKKAEAIVVQLTEKVLEHRVNSTAVADVPAGSKQQLDKWICVRKEREKVGWGEGESGRERKNCKGLSFLLHHSYLALQHPAAIKMHFR